jgi:2'-5' RNA ligase
VSDGHARLFVALELPGPVRGALAGWRDGLSRGTGAWLRPVAPESLHITLCFLGSRGEDEISAIAAACAVLTPEPVPALSLDAAVWLPQRRPRVLAVKLHDRGATLARVQALLAEALSAGGWYAPEGRPYLAHVTVARVKPGGHVPGDGGVQEAGPRRPPVLPPPPRLDFHAPCVVLYRSRPYRGGARYEQLARVELGAR